LGEACYIPRAKEMRERKKGKKACDDDKLNTPSRPLLRTMSSEEEGKNASSSRREGGKERGGGEIQFRQLSKISRTGGGKLLGGEN